MPIQTTLAGKYSIGRVLGKPGGFGVAYLGYDLNLQTRVVIKELMPRDLVGRGNDGASVVPHSPEDGDVFGYTMRRFIREGQLVAQFDHANIVRVLDFFEQNSTAYLVMPYHPGTTLENHLLRLGGTMRGDAATSITLATLQGLEEVHRRGLLHRDLKPSNVYVPDRGAAFLIDFGASRQVMGERSRSLTTVLTPGYAPFEQYHEHGNQGPWTDVYACAATLYRSVTGETPPDAPSRVAGRPLRRPGEIASGLDRNVEAAITEGLALQPEDRPQSASEFAARLRSEAPGRGPSGPGAVRTRKLQTKRPPGPSVGFGQRIAEMPLALKIGGFAVLGGLGVGVGFLTQNRAPVAGGDTAVTVQRRGVVVDVLANDQDPQGGAMTVDSTTAAAFGSVTILSDGRIRYTPEAAYSGTDEFAYYVSNSGGHASVGTVSVEVEEHPEVTALEDRMAQFGRPVRDRLGGRYTPDYVLVFDRFADNETGWPVVDVSGGPLVQVQGGRLEAEQRLAGRTRLVWLPNTPHQNILVRFGLEHLNGDTDAGAGFLFRNERVPNALDFVTLLLDVDGFRRYQISSYEAGATNNGWDDIVAWRAAPALVDGNNEIELLVAGDSMHVFLNESPIDAVGGIPISRGSQVGFIVEGGARFAFDDVVVVALSDPRDPPSSDSAYARLLAEANAAYARDDYGLASYLFSQAIQLRPDDLTALEVRANADYMLGDPEPCVWDYDRVVERHVSDRDTSQEARTRGNRGFCLLAMGERPVSAADPRTAIELGIADFRAAIALDTASVDPRVGLAIGLHLLNDPGAEQAFRDVVAREPAFGRSMAEVENTPYFYSDEHMRLIREMIEANP